MKHLIFALSFVFAFGLFGQISAQQTEKELNKEIKSKATKNARSGVFMSIVIAVVVIISYVFISEIFRVLGNRGDIPPVVAGMGPTIGFFTFACWNVFRSD